MGMDDRILQPSQGTLLYPSVDNQIMWFKYNSYDYISGALEQLAETKGK